jgi:hypothetical protein
MTRKKTTPRYKRHNIANARTYLDKSRAELALGLPAEAITSLAICFRWLWMCDDD